MSLRLSLVLILMTCFATTAVWAGGGSEVGNGHHAPARDMPKPRMPRDSDEGKADKKSDEKSGEKSGQTPDEGKPASGKHAAYRLRGAELSSVEILAGESLVFTARVEGAASEVLGCSGSLYTMEMTRGELAFDSCDLTRVGPNESVLRLTRAFAAETPNRRVFVQQLALETTGGSIVLPVFSAFQVDVRATRLVPELELKQATLVPEAAYGETFELVLELASASPLARVSLLFNVEYDDGTIEAESLELASTAQGYTDAPTNEATVGQPGVLAREVRVPMFVRVRTGAPRRLVFTSAYLQNAGLQDVVVPLRKQLVIELKPSSK